MFICKWNRYAIIVHSFLIDISFTSIYILHLDIYHKIKMTSTVAGVFLILNPQPQAIYNECDDNYRFYYRYTSHVLMDNLIGNPLPVVGTQIHDGLLSAEIWVPVDSPVIPFADRSLVHLRGRMILPRPDPNEDNPVFVLHIEVIYAQFQKDMSASQSPMEAIAEFCRPEVTVVGKVLHCSKTFDNTLTLLLEARDVVGDKVEKFVIG